MEMSVEIIIAIAGTLIIPLIVLSFKIGNSLKSLENSATNLQTAVTELRVMIREVEDRSKLHVEKELQLFKLRHETQHSEERHALITKLSETQHNLMEYVDERMEERIKKPKA